MFRPDIRASSVGVGGAPPVWTWTGRSSAPCSASAALVIIGRTVGAALKCAVPSVRSSRQISCGSILGKQTWAAPAADTPHGKHHPSHWNIGKVHRYRLDGPNPECIAMAKD